MDYTITLIDTTRFNSLVPQLADLLVDGVKSGASISFVQPFNYEDALSFWTFSVLESVAKGERLVFVAESAGQVLGVVQLITQLPPNQAHRCEIAKLIVHSNHRGKGIGKALMNSAITHGRSLGKTLMTLDTRTNDVSQQLYTSLGFSVAGIIPNFALDPDGSQLSATTYMYKQL